MTIQDQLDTLCRKTPTCELAAYVDLNSGLTLRWSAQTKHPREEMDLMAAHAVAGFKLVQTCTDKSEAAVDYPVHEIVHFNTRRAEVFARADRHSEDIVCAVTRQISDVATLLTNTSATIAKITEAEG